MNKSHIGKWYKIGVSHEDRDKIRERARSKAKTTLKNNHEKEYLKIVKGIQIEEYKRLEDLTKWKI